MRFFVHKLTNDYRAFDDNANVSDHIAIEDYDETTERPSIYHDYIEGAWQLVREAEQITTAINSKTAELKIACNESILAGFESSALGSLHHYDCDFHDQLNISGLDQADIDSEYPCVDQLEVKERRFHTKQQIHIVFLDGVAHIDSNLTNFSTKKDYLRTVGRTLIEVLAVTWESVE